jgi:hypothetical protein
MMFLALVSWWYGAGWARLAGRISRRMQGVLETFSVALLLRTLFDPFRQISAGQVKGSLDTQLRAMGDRAFSRVFGAVVRSLVILVGLLVTLLTGLVGVLQLIAWPFVPVLPLVGVVLAAMGVSI